MTYRDAGATTSLIILLGCGDLLGVPDDPRLVAPAVGSMDAPVGHGNMAAPSASPANVTDQVVPTGEAAASPNPGLATFDPAISDGQNLTDGGPAAATGVDASPQPALDAGLGSGAPPSGGSGVESCPALARESISDFTFTTGSSASDVRFGAQASFPGGTFFYPRMAGLSSDVTNDDWNLSGTVSGAAGFGLYMSTCLLLDASAFTGISFSVWGELEDRSNLVFVVETADQQVSHEWLNDHKANPTDLDVPANAGRCIPVAQRFDGSCRGARVAVPVTSTPTEVTISWRELRGGSPEDLVDPSEISQLVWEFPGLTDDAYLVDIHIDDLRFEAP